MSEDRQAIDRCLKMAPAAIVRTLWLLLTDSGKRREAWQATR